jgi:hypothetical protein
VLAGGAGVLFGRSRIVSPQMRVAPHIGGSAQLTTRTVSNGLAAMGVSLAPANARHFDVRYVVKRDATPEPGTIRITISAEGDNHEG